MKESVQLLLATMISVVAVALAADCETQPPAMECRAYLPAWYYNTQTRSCQLRTCHNSPANRYESKAACEQTCIRRAEPEGDGELPGECLLNAEVGLCNARIRRFFYDASSGRCRHFFYGGCNGNGNNFPSKRQCRRRCQVSTRDLDDRLGGISSVEIDQN